jgi:hypothetical protein
MSDIAKILDAIATTPGCSVSPPCGMPALPEGGSLPEDVRAFYERAGGAVLFSRHVVAGPLRILGPSEVQRIDQVIIGEPFASGPFTWWFAIVEVGDRSYIAIDLSPEHLGLCYDAYRDTFARPGYMNVIASSFSDLLNRLLAHREDSTYWLQEEFKPLGEGFALHGYKTL